MKEVERNVFGNMDFEFMWSFWVYCGVDRTLILVSVFSFNIFFL